MSLTQYEVPNGRRTKSEASVRAGERKEDEIEMRASARNGARNDDDDYRAGKRDGYWV